jgi:hypothetical protein
MTWSLGMKAHNLELTLIQLVRSTVHKSHPSTELQHHHVRGRSRVGHPSTNTREMRSLETTGYSNMSTFDDTLSFDDG